MGFYYDQGPGPGPDPDSKPGCLDVLVMTRVVFGILFWPLAALFLVLIDIAVIFYLFFIHPALALIPIAITVGAIWAFARWEQNRDRPEGLEDLPPPPRL
jgi:hypothetical protein